MVWGGMSYNEVYNLMLITDKQTSVTYTADLRHDLLDFAERTAGNAFTFQQDNAATHNKSIYTRDWVDENGLYTMNCSSKTPALNPIEDLSGILACSVYTNQHQFGTVADLQECIVEASNKISSDILHTLYSSMFKRCIQVVGHVLAQKKLFY